MASRTPLLPSTALLSGLLALAGCRGDDASSSDGTDTSETGEDPTFGDGDGDGDGDTTTGDGDGDTTTGDGDGDVTTGDGDGDTTTGDGDGDTTTGDGDGDITTGDGDGDTTTGDGDGDPDLAPFVVATSPADAAEGVAKATSISVTFSEAMDPATVTTNTADTSCSGAVQVSADDFATCVRMSAAPNTDDDTTFTVTPLAPLAVTAQYRIRVQAQVTDAGGTAMAQAFTTATGFAVRYSHTIVIDGTNDFLPDETFLSSTLGHVGYVAWDETYLYLGMSSPDLGGNNTTIWFVAYLGGSPGTTSGVLYNTQQPLIPFDARWHLRWKASDDFGGALEWDGNAWFNPGFGPIAGSQDVASSGPFLELRVPLAELENPELVPLHMGMLREQAFNEASWAAVPAGSYVDSYDPNYTQHFEFDLGGSIWPDQYAPL